MTSDETPRLVMPLWTWWRENCVTIIIIGLPAALLLGSLPPSFVPMRGRWLILEVIAGQVSGFLLSVILTALFKGPKAFLNCAQSSTPLMQIYCALDQIGYARAATLGSVVIFRPRVRAGFASGWITLRERDGRIALAGPYRHLVRLLARLQPLQRGKAEP
jgi:hypothetical protein